MPRVADMIAKVRAAYGPAARLWVLLIDINYPASHANENYPQTSPRRQFRESIEQIMKPILDVFRY